MQDWLTGNVRILVFAGICVGAFAIQRAWLRKLQAARPPWIIWSLAAVLIVFAGYEAKQAGAQSGRRIQVLTEGFARLYGHELEERGHWKLPSDAAADDPLYLD